MPNLKKIILSTIAITTLALTSVSADTSSDIAEMKAMMKQMSQRLAKLEAENTKLKATQKKQAKVVKQVQKKQHSPKQVLAVADIHEKPKGTLVKSKVPVLKFSGKHYLGFVSDGEKGTNKFETRRNYIQVKGYFEEGAKDYFRITLDTHHEAGGDWKVRLKYAYLYLDNVLPFTGVEIGQAHRPWIDYEEHNGWFYRSISKVFVEDGNAAHFTNSADLGVNFKTKTDYFSSELGIFNGEGYHGKTEDNTNVSAEWRLTGHILGTGKKHVHKSDTYANVSLFGQYNTGFKETTTSGKKDDFVWYGLHAVYNQPEFLIAAQYVNATDGGTTVEGNGWSVNGAYRFAENWSLIGRYDDFTVDFNNVEKLRTIAGVTYKYNKNVEFIANYLGEEIDGVKKTDAVMLTAEVNW